MQRIVYNIALLSVIFTLISCGKNKTNPEQDTLQKEANTPNGIFVSKAQFERSAMTLGTMEEKAFPITVKTTGMIDVPPENKAVVNATMGGYIKTTPLLIGDKVQKGQVVVTLENPEFISIQQHYMEVKEELSYLKVEFERQQTMRDENITSQKSFLKAESTYKSAQATYNGLRKQLQMLQISPTNVEAGTIVSVVPIYAPISGNITKINVNKGSYVSPATAILEIINNEHLHLELSVFEKDIMQLKKGQVIHFKIPESSKDTYIADVHLIGTSIEVNRTIKVHGHIENEAATHFLTGMFVDAEIVIESTLAKALPETAYAAIEDVYYVLLLKEKKVNGYYFEQIEVEIGEQDNHFIGLKNPEAFDTDAVFLTQGAYSLVGTSGE